jgi:hypothetical protein
MKEIARLIKLLGITEDEAMRALISSFASVQPGPMRQAFMRRPDYGGAPETSEIWELLVRSDFRCSECSTHYDLTLDHKDRDTRNNTIENLRVLCRDCNRAVNSRGLVNKHANLRVYKAIISLIDRLGRFPTPLEIREVAGLSQIGGAYYLIRFFESKHGAARAMRRYKKRRYIGRDLCAAANGGERL